MLIGIFGDYLSFRRQGHLLTICTKAFSRAKTRHFGSLHYCKSTAIVQSFISGDAVRFMFPNLEASTEGKDERRERRFQH